MAIIANPTATSAAATTMMKNTKICPLPSPLYAENAANSRFTEFNINSTHPKMMMAFFLRSTPKTPKQNNTLLKTIKCSKGTLCIKVFAVSIFYKSLFPINTAPTIPAKISTEAISNGKTYWLNNSFPKFLVKPTVASMFPLAFSIIKPL